MRKNYILDANVLLHDPQSVFQFADNTVIIPVGVIAEIDRFKKEMTARGYNAREIVRLLDRLRNGQSLATGVPLDAGGVLKVYCEPDGPPAGDGTADQEILRVAQRIRADEDNTPVVIVTKDINLRIRADAAGLRAEDYESDHVVLADLCVGQSERLVPAAQLRQLRGAGEIEVPDERVSPNEYLLLRPDDGSRGSVLARADAEAQRLVALRAAEGGICGIKPRNKEQYFAIDALLDEQLQLVSLLGKAGTGKTLLALAAAVHTTLKKKRYRAVLVCRPVVPVGGRDLGFLPGDVEAKLAPWMKPIVDTVEFLLDSGGPIKGFHDCAALLNSGLIEIQPLTYIRGRSIARRYVVIDEAQNLTPLEVKTIITRIGQEAKVVFTGDVYQIDNPYVDSESNGFTHLVNRFRDQPLAAHIELHKGERSSLAELAANLL